jgi:sodium/potassium-transporting ATPase subunit alpha
MKESLLNNSRASEFRNPHRGESVTFIHEVDPKKQIETDRVNAQLKVEKEKVIDSADIVEHHLSLEQLSKKYPGYDNKDPMKCKGLSTQKATSLQAEFGKNMMKPPKKDPLFLIFLHEFTKPMTALLLGAGVLSCCLYFFDQSMSNVYLGVALIVVDILNALIDFLQVQKAASIMDSFKNMVPQVTIVTRDSCAQKLPAEDLTIGDIIFMKEGDKIPADVRLIAATNFRVDNSSLTGESEPQKRGTIEAEPSVRVVEAENLAFGGTIVTSGEAHGIVVKIANDTVLGRLAGLASGDKRDSPLTIEIARFVRLISYAAGAMGILFFIAGMFINYNFSLNFYFLVGIFVANIPQGLPATVTLLLSMAVQNLSEKKVLVKDLQGVDTLGAITLLASDKTGTMTQNRMTVMEIWTNKRRYFQIQFDDAKGATNFQQGVFNLNVSGAQRLVQMCYVCSKAKFDMTPENLAKTLYDRKVLGDATETGLLKFASGYFEKEVLAGIEDIKKFEVPFNSRNKWALTIIHSAHKEGELLLFMKGAPERVFARCNSIYVDGKVRAKTDEDAKDFEATYEDMASQGLRVLSFAYCELPRQAYPANFEFTLDPPNYPDSGFVFMGLIGLMDPPKDRVEGAVTACRAAQIQVMMVTGDHPFTAESIARRIGLIQGDTIEQAAERLHLPVADVPSSEYSAIVIHGMHAVFLAFMFALFSIFFVRTYI